MSPSSRWEELLKMASVVSRRPSKAARGREPRGGTKQEAAAACKRAWRRRPRPASFRTEMTWLSSNRHATVAQDAQGDDCGQSSDRNERQAHEHATQRRFPVVFADLHRLSHTPYTSFSFIYEKHTRLDQASILSANGFFILFACFFFNSSVKRLC